MKTIILIAVILAVSMAVQMKRPMTNAQIQKYEQLKSGTKWASIMMNLAELHLMTSGPLDQLEDAIESVVSDLGAKVDSANEEYNQRTFEHNNEVDRIQSEIDSANEDIANTTELLNNILYVQEAQLTEDIANLQVSIASTQQYILDQTAERIQEHNDYLEVAQEHVEALEAVFESLDILAELVEGGQSLLQINKAKKSLSKVQEKISKHTEGSIIKALLALTSGEFANQDSLKKVGALLQTVVQNLTDSAANYLQQEQDADAYYRTDIAQKKVELNNFTVELYQKQQDLEVTIESIADNELFLAQRTSDLAGDEEDLEDENNNFVKLTRQFEDLVEELSSEQDACASALDVLQNADIASYIGNRMSQNGPVISAAKGQNSIPVSYND